MAIGVCVGVERCPSVLDLHAYDILQNWCPINYDNNIMFALSLYLLILIH